MDDNNNDNGDAQVVDKDVLGSDGEGDIDNDDADFEKVSDELLKKKRRKEISKGKVRRSSRREWGNASDQGWEEEKIDCIMIQCCFLGICYWLDSERIIVWLPPVGPFSRI
ncbi:hypothetical protein OIU76_018861 [Salix suchowensis]|nr:hypothetical protein OIU76_018861 [Salix suchowensis]